MFKKLKKFALFSLALWALGVKPAHALCGNCELAVNLADDFIWQEAEDDFDTEINNQWVAFQRFIVHQMWEQSILPAMMLMAEQMTAVALQQSMLIGMFIDVEIQIKTQRLLQEVRAQAHKDYHPSEGMCTFGSLMKGVAASERRSEVAAVILAQRSQDRQLGQADTAGRYGYDLDFDNRIWQFKNYFCDEKERGYALELREGMSIGIGIGFGDMDDILYSCSSNMRWWENTDFDADKRMMMNKDIDFFRLVDFPWTISMDLRVGTYPDLTITSLPSDDRIMASDVRTIDNMPVFAMATNLYGYETFPRIPPRLLARDLGELTPMQEAYMDMRSIVAKRSVAENSFYAIAAMKGEGYRDYDPDPNMPTDSRVYMEHILAELGVPASDILPLLGEYPSYYAQMEVLTKKLYQDPDFYTDLYDKPANVQRKTVAMQAIKLMQKFDMLKSMLRGEANFSILLELAVMELQGEMEEEIKNVRAQ
ncbi:MAG: hypothetical protein GC137_07050 [Alphaproteobacteria bacterium]|nr:hypothetical protein [Alphaproteobacteria bacterium]